MIRRDKSKQVIIENVNILDVSFAAVVQVGDVFGETAPFSYGEAYGGYRGAPSFATSEVAEGQNTRLHYANQLDEDVLDFAIIGEDIVTYRPNTRGEGTR